jgi:phosphoribosyl-ATP pyrophosphohydrolase
MITEDFIGDIENITKLSLRLHGTKEKADDYTLNSMIEHASEIKELLRDGNPHWAIETGDLMIHCMRLLTANGHDLNEIFERCKSHFITRISEKLGGQSQRYISI